MSARPVNVVTGDARLEIAGAYRAISMLAAELIVETPTRENILQGMAGTIAALHMIDLALEEIDAAQKVEVG